jgi:hypothetical protein
MTLARLALLVGVYVTLDVANPMMPGALTFGVEESVEVRPSERLRDQIGKVVLVAAVPDAAGVDVVPRMRVPSPRSAPITWASRRAHMTRSQLSVPHALSSSEGH